MDKAITVNSVTRRFGEITAVDNLSFEVMSGETRKERPRSG